MFGARADGSTDDRGSVQAAIDHVAGIGGGTVFLPPGRYKIVAPRRKSDPADRHRLDGAHLVIDRGNVALVGAGPRRSMLCFRALGDESHDDHWQVVRGKVWRGDGIVVRGGVDATTKIDQIRIAGLTLDGGARRSGSIIWPANPLDGRGWDLTHKAIRLEEDLYVGRMTIEDCEIRHWRGELIFQGGPNGDSMTIRRCLLHDGDGDAISSSMGNIVYDCLISDVSFAGIECGYYDKPSHYHHNQIVNAGYEGISLFYVPGKHAAGRQYLHNMVVRNCRKGLIGKSLTNAVISDIEFIDCGWTTAGYRTIQLYDTPVSPCADVDIRKVRIVIDHRDLNVAVGLIRTGGVDWRNVRLSGLTLDRTSAAVVAGRSIGRLVEPDPTKLNSIPATVLWSKVERAAIRREEPRPGQPRPSSPEARQPPGSTIGGSSTKPISGTD